MAKQINKANFLIINKNDKHGNIIFHLPKLNKRKKKKLIKQIKKQYGE